MIILHCPDCKADRTHRILPWQSSPGKFGSISVMCNECIRLEIFMLGAGMKIQPENLEGL